MAHPQSLMENKIKVGLIGLFILVLGIAIISNWFVSKDESRGEPPVFGGPCSYDKFKGKCKIISIFDENGIKFRFIPTEPLNLENVGWVKSEKDITDREYEQYAGYLGLKCLDKYPITKEDLEKCNIKENAVFDCEIGLITKGTCSPTTFTFLPFTIEKISFLNLKNAVEFISKCLENDDYKKLSETCIGGVRKNPPYIVQHKVVFEMLKEQNQKIPLIKLYSEIEFPKDKDKFKLGGHMSELGCIHIDFVKKDGKWYIGDIWSCK